MPALRTVMGAALFWGALAPVSLAEEGRVPPLLLAELVLPDAMSGPQPRGEIARNLRLGLDAWEKLKDYDRPSQPDRLVVRDFAPVPLADGSVVFPGLGVRLRDTTFAGQQVMEILDVQEYGAFWKARENPAIQVGGLLGGQIASLEQTLRVELSRSGDKKTRQGFGITITTATPYKHKGADRVQTLPGRLLVEPMVQPRGRWLVAEPEAPPGQPSPAEAHAALAAEFRDRLASAPCAMDGRALMTYERRMDLIETASDSPLPFVNFRQEQKAACAIATHGAYDMAHMRRLAVLRNATCADLEAGLSEQIETLAADLRREVGPPRYIDYASIGIFDLTTPSRVPDPVAQADRRACVVRYLEDSLFSPD
ncbi:hypothetical protein [Maliponia aquimaris]|uniref:Uncharacterized protein n=1 Tax=Maliponia aquimaris TaxID=1673631 RepID=A0A238JYB3_9RHOB|nr:hypothetical protein [Maliponia aquimaris]SMX35639.1 hypothetical protein MAA8898_00595 [Maliponia aquimaris]